MGELHSMLIAGLTGFVSGLLLCIPVGPINLIILNEGARRGFLWPFMIGLGATLMEVIYCFFAFTGFASFFEKGLVKAAMDLCSFIFLLVIGIKFLLAKSVEAPLHISKVALWDPEANKGVRVGIRRSKDGKTRERISKASDNDRVVGG